MFLFVLGGCSSMMTYVSPDYSVSKDNTAVLKHYGRGQIGVGTFTNKAEFDNDCGINAGTLAMPNKLSFEEYIRKGLVKELEAAGMYDDSSEITLSGTIEKLEFFSRINIYTSYWKFGVRLNSSNGKSLYVTEQFNFDAGGNNRADCQEIANAYMPAVQKILNKVIAAPEFEFLITP